MDLASLVSTRIDVIDGVVGAELDEINRRSVRMDLVIAGVDIVATDVVVAAVMDIDPRRLGYIRLAEEKGLGVGDLREIEVIREEIEAVKGRFKLPETRDGRCATSRMKPLGDPARLLLIKISVSI